VPRGDRAEIHPHGAAGARLEDQVGERCPNRVPQSIQPLHTQEERIATGRVGAALVEIIVVVPPNVWENWAPAAAAPARGVATCTAKLRHSGHASSCAASGGIAAGARAQPTALQPSSRTRARIAQDSIDPPAMAGQTRRHGWGALPAVLPQAAVWAAEVVVGPPPFHLPRQAGDGLGGGPALAGESSIALARGQVGAFAMRANGSGTR
jgi:hypothetical protein